MTQLPHPPTGDPLPQAVGVALAAAVREETDAVAWDDEVPDRPELDEGELAGLFRDVDARLLAEATTPTPE